MTMDSVTTELSDDRLREILAGCTDPDCDICTAVTELLARRADTGMAEAQGEHLRSGGEVVADAPLVSRWDEGGFTDYLNEDAPTIVRDLDGPAAALLHVDTRKVIGYRVYDAGRAREAIEAIGRRK